MIAGRDKQLKGQLLGPPQQGEPDGTFDPVFFIMLVLLLDLACKIGPITIETLKARDPSPGDDGQDIVRQIIVLRRPTPTFTATSTLTPTRVITTPAVAVSSDTHTPP